MPLKIRRRYFEKMGLKIPEQRTAAHRIGNTFFPFLENGWFREKFGELRNMARVRRPGSVAFDAPNPKDRSLIHTHLLAVHERNPRTHSASYPSEGDIDTMFQMIRDLRGNYNIRFWHIATTNKEGSVIGYFTLHTPPRFIQWALDEKTVLPTPKGETDIDRSHNYLENLQAVGLKLSATAMPGYYFRHGQFKPLLKR